MTPSRIFATLLMIALTVTGATTCADESPGLVQQRPASGRSVRTPQGFMVPYTACIPGTDASFEMEPVPGGIWTISLPAAQDKRAPHTKRIAKLQVPPFWIGKHEVTWSEFRHYMDLHRTFRALARQRKPQDPKVKPDAVTAPSDVYDISFAHQSGTNARLPAVTMTQFTAKQYTCWLSKLTTDQYRLPTAMEWEYACRAGKTTPFHFGSRHEQLDTYAWHFGNSHERAHIVGQKKPNAWGLHDMHGNVWEWVVDRYSPQPWEGITGTERDVIAAVRWPKSRASMTVCGGSWADFPREGRADSRLRSQDVQWKRQDPHLPRSPWWFTDSPADTIGFRIVRSLTPLPDTQMHRFWYSTIPQEAAEVNTKLHEGRGAVGRVHPQLPRLLKQLDNKK